MRALPSEVTEAQKDVLRVARSVIRDFYFHYHLKELQEHPQKICERLSELLDEKYDFEKGEVRG